MCMTACPHVDLHYSLPRRYWRRRLRGVAMRLCGLGLPKYVLSSWIKKGYGEVDISWYASAACPVVRACPINIDYDHIDIQHSMQGRSQMYWKEIQSWYLLYYSHLFKKADYCRYRFWILQSIWGQWIKPYVFCFSPALDSSWPTKTRLVHPNSHSY